MACASGSGRRNFFYIVCESGNDREQDQFQTNQPLPYREQVSTMSSEAFGTFANTFAFHSHNALKYVFTATIRTSPKFVEKWKLPITAARQRQRSQQCHWPTSRQPQV
jgi:hypothetical protein